LLIGIRISSGGKSLSCPAARPDKFGTHPSPGVCPKIVGQLLAVVLQGGQARQNRGTPAPGRKLTGFPRRGIFRGKTPYRKRRRTGGVGPGPAPREAGEGGSPLRTPGLNGPGSRRTNGAGTALSSPGRSRHRYPGGGDRKPALPVPAKEWGWPTNPLVPPARGFLFPAAGLRRVAPRAIRRPSLIEGRALFLSALRRSKGGFHLERSGECDA